MNPGAGCVESTAAGPAGRQGAPSRNRRQGSALVLVEAESVITSVCHPSAAHSAGVSGITFAHRCCAAAGRRPSSSGCRGSKCLRLSRAKAQWRTHPRRLSLEPEHPYRLE